MSITAHTHGNSQSIYQHTIEYLAFNHPKNYLGVPLCIADPQPTNQAISDYLVGMEQRAQDGAITLGLLTSDYDLTPLGATIVNRVRRASTLQDELTRFSSLQGSTTRFVNAVPDFWIDLTQEVIQHYPVAGDIVTGLEQTGTATLAEFAEWVDRTDHQLQDILFRTPSAERDSYGHPEIYQATAVYQLKTLLYHSGILTERGKDTTAIDPETDLWQLEPAVFIQGGERP